MGIPQRHSRAKQNQQRAKQKSGQTQTNKHTPMTSIIITKEKERKEKPTG